MEETKGTPFSKVKDDEGSTTTPSSKVTVDSKSNKTDPVMGLDSNTNTNQNKVPLKTID